MSQVAQGVQRLRARLLAAGFEHGPVGELRRRLPDGRKVYVRTGYTHASYRITAMGRNNGSRTGQCYVDVSDGTQLATRIDEIAEALCSDTMPHWPPHPMMHPATTGWGDGQIR